MDKMAGLAASEKAGIMRRSHRACRGELKPPEDSACGRGVKTVKNRLKGKPLFPYSGEEISGYEGERRDNQESTGFRFFFKRDGENFCIDASKEDDSLGRLVNHGSGKHANCVMKLHMGTLWIFCLRDIMAGEELLYDYGIRPLPWSKKRKRDETEQPLSPHSSEKTDKPKSPRRAVRTECLDQADMQSLAAENTCNILRDDNCIDPRLLVTTTTVSTTSTPTTMPTTTPAASRTECPDQADMQSLAAENTCNILRDDNSIASRLLVTTTTVSTTSTPTTMTTTTPAASRTECPDQADMQSLAAENTCNILRDDNSIASRLLVTTTTVSTTSTPTTMTTTTPADETEQPLSPHSSDKTDKPKSPRRAARTECLDQADMQSLAAENTCNILRDDNCIDPRLLVTTTTVSTTSTPTTMPTTTPAASRTECPDQADMQSLAAENTCNILRDDNSIASRLLVTTTTVTTTSTPTTMTATTPAASRTECPDQADMQSLAAENTCNILRDDNSIASRLLVTTTTVSTTSTPTTMTATTPAASRTECPDQADMQSLAAENTCNILRDDNSIASRLLVTTTTVSTTSTPTTMTTTTPAASRTECPDQADMQSLAAENTCNILRDDNSIASRLLVTTTTVSTTSTPTTMTTTTPAASRTECPDQADMQSLAVENTCNILRDDNSIASRLLVTTTTVSTTSTPTTITTTTPAASRTECPDQADMQSLAAENTCNILRDDNSIASRLLVTTTTVSTTSTPTTMTTTTPAASRTECPDQADMQSLAAENTCNILRDDNSIASRLLVTTTTVSTTSTPTTITTTTPAASRTECPDQADMQSLAAENTCNILRDDNSIASRLLVTTTTVSTTSTPTTMTTTTPAASRTECPDQADMQSLAAENTCNILRDDNSIASRLLVTTTTVSTTSTPTTMTTTTPAASRTECPDQADMQSLAAENTCNILRDDNSIASRLLVTTTTVSTTSTPTTMTTTTPAASRTECPDQADMQSLAAENTCNILRDDNSIASRLLVTTTTVSTTSTPTTMTTTTPAASRTECPDQADMQSLAAENTCNILRDDNSIASRLLVTTTTVSTTSTPTTMTTTTPAASRTECPDQADMQSLAAENTCNILRDDNSIASRLLVTTTTVSTTSTPTTMTTTTPAASRTECPDQADMQSLAAENTCNILRDDNSIASRLLVTTTTVSTTSTPTTMTTTTPAASRTECPDQADMQSLAAENTCNILRDDNSIASRLLVTTTTVSTTSTPTTMTTTTPAASRTECPDQADMQSLAAENTCNILRDDNSIASRLLVTTTTVSTTSTPTTMTTTTPAASRTECPDQADMQSLAAENTCNILRDDNSIASRLLVTTTTVSTTSTPTTMTTTTPAASRTECPDQADMQSLAAENTCNILRDDNSIASRLLVTTTTVSTTSTPTTMTTTTPAASRTECPDQADMQSLAAENTCNILRDDNSIASRLLVTTTTVSTTSTPTTMTTTTPAASRTECPDQADMQSLAAENTCNILRDDNSIASRLLVTTTTVSTTSTPTTMTTTTPAASRTECPDQADMQSLAAENTCNILRDDNSIASRLLVTTTTVSTTSTPTTMTTTTPAASRTECPDQADMQSLAAENTCNILRDDNSIASRLLVTTTTVSTTSTPTTMTTTTPAASRTECPDQADMQSLAAENTCNILRDDNSIASRLLVTTTTVSTTSTPTTMTTTTPAASRTECPDQADMQSLAAENTCNILRDDNSIASRLLVTTTTVSTTSTPTTMTTTTPAASRTECPDQADMQSLAAENTCNIFRDDNCIAPRLPVTTTMVSTASTPTTMPTTTPAGNLHPYIGVKLKNNERYRLFSLSNTYCLIGRSRDCDIIVSKRGVKSVHFQLEVMKDHVLLDDSGTIRKLNAGDSFHLMDREFQLIYLQDQAEEEDNDDDDDTFNESSDNWEPSGEEDEEEDDEEEGIEEEEQHKEEKENYISDSEESDHADNVSEVFGDTLNPPITIQKSGREGKRCQKLQSCLYCEKLVITISRHLERKHSNEKEVAKVLLLPKRSRERRNAWEQILAKGNYNHNCEVLKKGRGTMIPKYRPRKCEEKEKDKYLPCDTCYSFFIDTDLWKHKRSCAASVNQGKSTKGEGIYHGKLLVPVNNTASTEFFKNVLARQRDDDININIRSDELIIRFGERLFEKIGHHQQNAQYISQRMRQLSRLLLEMNQKTLEDCIHPRNWNSLIQGVKSVSGYDSKTGLFDIPSMPLKLGHSLQKCAKILKTEGTIEQNKVKIENAESFLTLYADEWNERVSAKALETLHRKKFNKPTMIPTVEDVAVFHRYLESEAEKAVKSGDHLNYADIAEICLAQVISFNRKRSGEVEQIQLEDYDAIKNSFKVDKEITASLSKFETALLENHYRLEIRGKKGSKVPVLLTKAMKANIDHMLSLRPEVDSNFLFAKEGSPYPIRGTDVMRRLAQKCGCKNPELIRSTNMRKQLATISQVLNLTSTDQDLLAKFLGHNIAVHREYYRLPQSTLEVAKVSKILHAVNEGNISDLKGKSLDEIQFQDTELEGEPEDLEENAVEDEEEDVDTPTMSTDQEQTGSSSVRRRFLRRPWGPQEKAAVRRNMAKHFKLKTLPGKKECLEVLVKESVLSLRTWKQIKDFVRNSTKRV